MGDEKDGLRDRLRVELHPYTRLLPAPVLTSLLDAGEQFVRAEVNAETQRCIAGAENVQRMISAAKDAEIEQLRGALVSMMGFRGHLRGCEYESTEFCTCGLKQCSDTARDVLGTVKEQR
jgi:hypothetical protein